MQIIDKNIKFSIVIPVYNEEINITILFKEIIQAVEGKYQNYEIIFVNDGSTDGTKEQLKNIINNKLKIFHIKKRSGKSNALYQGALIAKYNNLINLDGDLQNDPADIPKLLQEYIITNSDLIIGSRTKRIDSYFRIIQSITANLILNYILDTNIKDTGCGFKIYKKDIFLKINFPCNPHRYLAQLFIFNGFKVTNKCVSHRRRRYGKSKYGINRLYTISRDIYKLKKYQLSLK